MLTTFKQAFRSLRLSPSFTITVIVTLGIGIGLNAAIFTVVDNVLLKPLGYHDADRIVGIQTHFLLESRSIPRLAAFDYDDLLHEVHGLEAIAYYQSGPDGLAVHGTSLYTAVAVTSPQFMQVMGVQPLAGRLFNPVDREGNDVLVSASFARNDLGSEPGTALGQTILFSGKTYTVAGVLPGGFSFPGKTEVWFEAPAKERLGSRSSYNNRVVAKRAASISEGQLKAELDRFSLLTENTYAENKNKSMEAVSLQEQLTGRVRPTLHLLMGSVAVILLIVCANVTHLQLVRATRNVRTATIRTALGASRSELAGSALLETMVLALAGTGVAVLLAVPALRLLVSLAPVNTPRLADIHLNLDVLAFSILASLLVMIGTALLPVWRSWHVDPAAALRSDSSRGMESRASLRLRSSLIVAEIALTLMLSVASLLLTRQLIAQSHQDLGFQPDALITLDAHAILPPRHSDVPDAADGKAGEVKLQHLEALLASASAVPGVTSAAAITGAPMGFGGADASFAIRGRTEFGMPDVHLPSADMRPVTPDVFRTLGVPLLRGRTFTTDDRPSSPRVIVVSRQLANEFFPNQDPIGQQLKFGYDFAVPQWDTIVGVVGDVRGQSPSDPPGSTVYLAFAQHPREADNMQLVVRTTLSPAAMIQTLEKALPQSHPEFAIASTTMTQNIKDVQQSDTFRTTLFTLFAAVSIFLAAIGMYGVTSYTVAQRRFEFGLRAALGASRSQLLTMVLGSAVATAGLGIVLGMALSLGLQRVLASVIGKLPAFDAVAYALASAGVLVLALVATLLPARRAANVDPMQVLRSE